MALRLRFAYSINYGAQASGHGALGAGATWTQFADIADGGGGGTVDFNAPTLGTTYWYRAQRYETSTGATSAWSDVYQHQALLPLGSTRMNQIDPCSIVTAADLRFGIAFEPFSGVPAKARWLIRCEGGWIQRQLGRRYGKVRANNRARRMSAKKGRYSFGGTLRFTFTPERAVPTMLGCMFPIATTALTTPTRYLHEFSNLKTCKTVTLHAQIDATTVIVYPGCVVSGARFVPSLENDDPLTIEFDVVATDAFVVQGGTALADTGMDVAVMDLLPEYDPEDFILDVAGQSAGFRDMSVGLDLDLQPVLQRGWHAPVAFYNKSTGLSIEGNGYFRGISDMSRDMGHSATPATNFGPICTVQQVAATISASPCIPSGQAFANLLTITVPKADIVASETAGDAQGEFEQSINVVPIYDAGGGLGTDFKIGIVNSQTNAQLTLPGASLSPLKVPATNSRPYTYDLVGAGATTTSIPLASIGNANIDQVNAAYVGHQVKIIKASDGTVQTATVLTYTAPTGGAAGSLTLTAAITAPSAGDTVVFL